VAGGEDKKTDVKKCSWRRGGDRHYKTKKPQSQRKMGVGHRLQVEKNAALKMLKNLIKGKTKGRIRTKKKKDRQFLGGGPCHNRD